MMDSRLLFHLCVRWIIYSMYSRAQTWNNDFYSSPHSYWAPTWAVNHVFFQSDILTHQDTVQTFGKLCTSSFQLPSPLFFCGLILLGVSLPLWPAVINSACSKGKPPLCCHFAWEIWYLLTTWVCFHMKIIPSTRVNAAFNWQWQDNVWPCSYSCSYLFSSHCYTGPWLQFQGMI